MYGVLQSGHIDEYQGICLWFSIQKEKAEQRRPDKKGAEE
jgi:hypothetical protein